MERYTGMKYESELIQEYLAVNYGVQRKGPEVEVTKIILTNVQMSI